ncbi:MAG: GNAT family N-acetyltransferase [Nocardioides sp.]
MRPAAGALRQATAADAARLVALWALVPDDDDSGSTGWREHALGWFARCVDDPATARFPVVEVGGEVVATAIGTLELGVPNPHCPQGRTVRLANVLTLPAHRGHGFATLLVRDVVAWARSVEADRVDLSATPEGLRLYARLGFDVARAPRMKLVL